MQTVDATVAVRDGREDQMMRAAAPMIQIGSPEHRQILARFFLESHVDFVPESIVWPQLADSSRTRLTRLPFWQEAVATENITSNTVAAAAQLEPDPEIRKAIEMQGFEENRHARLLVALTSHYSIKVDMPPRFEPHSLESDFLFAGFGECFDSFFAFGLFALAQKSGYFGPELIAIFEPVVQEEARHILFFVNWVKYRRSQLPWWKRPGFRLRCAWIILKQVARRIKTWANPSRCIRCWKPVSAKTSGACRCTTRVCCGRGWYRCSRALPIEYYPRAFDQGVARHRQESTPRSRK